MSMFFTLPNGAFQPPPVHAGAEDLHYYKTIGVEAIYTFEAVGLNAIIVGRSNAVAVTTNPSGGIPHAAYNLLDIAFNPGNAIASNHNSIALYCLIKAEHATNSLHK